MIHSGDCSNSKNIHYNNNEVRNFIEWYSKVNVEFKIYIAGNHCTSIEQRVITKDDFTKAGIIYLDLEEVTIKGIKFFGSAYTPSFGQWAFMKSRGKLAPYYEQIPNDTDVLISHGPVYGTLDLSYDRHNNLEFCGCKELKNRVNKLNLKAFFSGHIHSMSGVTNFGITYREGVYYSNAALVLDGRFDRGLVYNGNLFNVDENKNFSIISSK